MASRRGQRPKNPPNIREGTHSRILPPGVNYSWIFSQADRDGPWPYRLKDPDDRNSRGFTQEEQSKILNSLAGFETLERSKMERKGDGSHKVPVIKLRKEARDRLRAITSPGEFNEIEEGTLFSLRISQLERVWCFRRTLAENQNICRILWWDPEHTVYPIDIQDQGKKRRRG